MKSNKIQELYFAISYNKDCIGELQQKHTQVLSGMKTTAKKTKKLEGLKMEHEMLTREYDRLIKRNELLKVKMELLTDSEYIIDAPGILKNYSLKGGLMKSQKAVKRLFGLPINMTARVVIEKEYPDTAAEYIEDQRGPVTEEVKDETVKMEVKR